MKIFSLLLVAFFKERRSFSMSCCPPNAEKYLAARYNTIGQVQCNAEGFEFYFSGSPTSSKAVIIIPDIWGWNGGRTRNIADWLGDMGFYTVVPKLLVPPLDGGTDGDGFPPDFDFGKDGSKFVPYMKTITWDDILKPRLISVVNHIKAHGIHKISLVGFCWGGWVGAHALAGDIAENFRCLAIPHPSITLEERVFQKSTMELIERIQKPVLLMPTKGDPDEYREHGAFFKILKAKFPTADTVDFNHVNHGFVPRGDTADPKVGEAIKIALSKMLSFLNAHNE